MIRIYNNFMSFSFIEFISILAFLTTFISYVPQAIKIYNTRSSADVCIISTINAFICSISWILYGLLINDTVVWASNVPMLFSSFYIIIAKIKKC